MGVSVADIVTARRTLAGVAVRTPLLHVPTLDRELGVELYVKAEALQRTGSFKFRGAYNKIASLTAAEREQGIIAMSAGNHALAVAVAAVMQRVKPCVVCMPEVAVAVKIAAVREQGVDVVLHGRDSAALFAKVAELREEYGYNLVHPFDDHAVVAGAGTAGLELIEDAPPLDYVVVPTSGGGLIGGIAVAVKALSPATKVIGVQPESCAGLVLSLQAGSVQEAPPPETIADGLTARRPGALNFALVRDLVDDVVTVSDEQIKAAMRPLYRHAKLLVEAAGAAALAHVMDSPRFRGKRVAIIASGGNVGPELAAEIAGSMV